MRRDEKEFLRAFERLAYSFNVQVSEDLKNEMTRSLEREETSAATYDGSMHNPITKEWFERDDDWYDRPIGGFSDW